jgi:hypothetical protein
MDTWIISSSDEITREGQGMFLGKYAFMVRKRIGLNGYTESSLSLELLIPQKTIDKT